MQAPDDLLAAVLERPVEEWSSALDELCAAHAAVAPELRRRFAVLRRMGFTDPAGPGLAAPAADPFPEHFGPYRLLQRLGGGGMGMVYLARHEELGRNVALKLIRPERLYFADARERFRREIEAVARLEHPGCVQIHQVGEAHGVPYFAMEQVAGVSFAQVVQALAGRAVGKLTGHDLAQVLRQSAAHSVETASSELFAGPWVRVCLRLVLAVAEALVHAHARGVVHRDVKPANLMLTPEGRVVVVDFGLAVAAGTSRLTRTGAFLGSLPYMAPEQVRGEQTAIDARTDVYALGVCLYELLTLVSPFESASAETTRDSILAGKALSLRARNAAVSTDVAVICAMAMDVDPRRRYQRTADFAADLAAVLEHRAIAARPAGVLRSATRWARRHPAAATAAILCGIALVCGPLIVSLAIAGQRDRALEAERLARRREYAANIAAANAALLAGNGSEARHRLDACPQPARGFEWHHLDLALDGALLTLRAHGAPVTAVALAADGSKAAAGAANGEVAVFDVATATCLHTLPTGARVSQVEFDQAADELYVTSAGHLRVFAVATGTLLRERAPGQGFESLLVSPGARRVFCDLGGGHLAEFEPRTLRRAGEVALASSTELPHGFFLSDGERIASAIQIGGIATWNATTGQLLGQARVQHGISSMCIQRDFARIACADRGGSLTWIDTATSTAHSLDPAGRIACDLALTRDGRHLVVGCDAGEVLVYALPSGKLVRRLHGHRGEVSAVVVGTEDDLLLSGGQDGSVRLWSPFLAPEALDLRGFGDGAGLVADAGEHLFFGNRDALLRSLHARTGVIRWQSTHGHWINSMALVRAGRVVATTYYNVLRFTDAGSGTELGEVSLSAEAGYFDHMVADAGGSTLFVASQRGHIFAVDVETHTVLGSAEIHAGPVHALLYDAAARTLVSAGQDGCVYEIQPDLTAPRRIASSGSAVAALVLDGSDVICSEKGALCRRDRRTGAILQRQACPTYFTAMVMLGPDRLVTGSADGRVGFWDRRELELIIELKQPAQSVWNLAADAQARFLAVSCYGGDPRILYAHPAPTGDFAALRQRAQDAAARELATQVLIDWPWSTAAAQALQQRTDLSVELRHAAERLLPPATLWSVMRNAIELGKSAASIATRRPELLRCQAMLTAALRLDPGDAFRPSACLGLGLVCIRLGDPRAALSALEDLAPRTLASEQPDFWFVRAQANARLGHAKEAAAAVAELRALIAGEFAHDPSARSYLREIEAGAR